MALWSFIGPSVNGMMSRHVGPSEQGQLQGANGSIMGVAGLIGPTIFTQLFAAAIAYAGTRYAGAPYLLAGVFLAFAGVIALRVTAASPNTPP